MPNNLRPIRIERRLTQDKAADALGTTRSQYAKLETGKRRLTIFWIERAASAFEVDPGQIVTANSALQPPLVGSMDLYGTVRVSTDNMVPGLIAFYLGCCLGPLLDGWFALADVRQSMAAGSGLGIACMGDRSYCLGRHIVPSGSQTVFQRTSGRVECDPRIRSAWPVVRLVPHL